MLKLEALNEAQRKAVMHGDGPLLVLAGPGSGKTFTVTQRILYLLEVVKVPAEKILVITFTNEAARSMQLRFQEQSALTHPVNFGTFHSVFYHILKSCNASCTRQLLREHQKKNLILSLLPNNLADSYSLYLAAISFYKNTGDYKKAEAMLPESSDIAFAEIFRRYEHQRRQAGAMDFDDMIYECVCLLQNNISAREYWSQRFSHILIDEFQDINTMQYRAVGLLSQKPYNLFAVGDDDQSIYGFRGSRPACLKQFEKEYNAGKILLNVNYRSYPEIVKASSKVIENNGERFEKSLQSCEGNIAAAMGIPTGEMLKLIRFQEKEEQYNYLLQKLEATYIAEGSRSAASANKECCAVLFRTNIQMQAFAARLQKRGIPFCQKESASVIYDHFIYKDILAYLRIAAGVKDRKYYLQILNKPVRHLSREMLYRQTEESVPVIKDPAMVLLENQLEYLKKVSPYLAVNYILRVIGYEKYLKEQVKKLPGGENRWEEWCEIIAFIKEEARSYQSHGQWMADCDNRAVKNQQKGRSHKVVRHAEENCRIQLMTVHASKGLEFERVFIPDCNEKIYPYGRMPDRDTCEEECRVFYVAMTRAKKSLEILYLTGTRERPRLPSRFLNPLFQIYRSEIYSSTSSSNSQLSRYSSKASATFSYSSSSSMQRSSGSSLGSSGFSL